MGDKLSGQIRVHAGKTVDKDGFAFLEAMGLDVPKDLPTGGYIGEVTIVDCIDERKGEYDSPWIMEDYGPYGFVLEDPIAYKKMILARGRLGIWKSSESDLLWG